jgi:hypothetical protein
MTVKTYDGKCADLAGHFLENDRDAVFDASDVESLALAIQQAVEDWFELNSEQLSAGISAHES